MSGGAQVAAAIDQAAASAIQGATTAFSILANTLITAKRVNKVLQKQEKMFLQNATIQAERLRFQGAVDLRNLRVQSAIKQGRSELAVSSQGGVASGSALDVLMANRKSNTLDERVVQLNTLWAMDNAKRDGYIQAINTAGQAMGMSYNALNNALTSASQYALTVANNAAKNTHTQNQSQIIVNSAANNAIANDSILNFTYGTNYNSLGGGSSIGSSIGSAVGQYVGGSLDISSNNSVN